MSKSAVQVQCWKCNESFANTRDRKNHMSSRDHNCLSVVCPFCPKRRTFKRSTPELRDHVKSHHGFQFAELKDQAKEFFAETNGYWLAVYPRDYRHLVQPGDFNGPAAAKARDLVRAWVQKVGGTESAKILAEWESGWKGQKRSERSSSLESESAFVPDYEDSTIRAPTPAKKIKANPPSHSTEYAPEKPELDIGNLHIQSIDPKEHGGMETLLYTEGENPVWYLATISKNVYEDPKSVASIFRRSTTVTNAGIQPPTHMTNLSLNDQSRNILCSIADTLGVSKRYLERVQCGISFEPAPPGSTEPTPAVPLEAIPPISTPSTTS